MIVHKCRYRPKGPRLSGSRGHSRHAALVAPYMICGSGNGSGGGKKLSGERCLACLLEEWCSE